VRTKDPFIKIVQTLWTKPVFDGYGGVFGQKFNGGWISRKYYYMSWALSCLQFGRFYEYVELVTDKRGKEILIDYLGLPYTNVKVELDRLNKYPVSLWTLPKIHTYKIQDEPFIHADGDVFIWEKFGRNIESSRLCSQQQVINHKPQYHAIKEIEDHFDYIPDCIRKDIAGSKVLRISNAGILGGNDLDFFKEYAKISYEFVDRNISQIDKLRSGCFGMIFEEYLFYCLAREKGIEITYLLEPLSDDFTGTQLIGFETAPGKTKFIHPVGSFKKYSQVCDQLADVLLLNYPSYYYMIMKLLHDFKI